MEKIRQYFEKSVKLSEEDWQFFCSKLIKQEFPKNHHLLTVGQTENYLSFIETGMVRFYIPKEENDLTFSFVFDHNFVRECLGIKFGQQDKFVATSSECLPNIAS